MHKILKGVGASALAATTVVTGLSFGPATLAASPAPDSNAIGIQPANGSTFKLVVKNSDDRYWGQSTPSDTNLRTYATRALAEASSASLTTTTVDNSFSAKFTEGPLKDNCLSVGSVSGTPKLRFDPSCGAPQTLFSIDDQGRLTSTPDGLYVAAETKIATGGRWFALGSGGWGANFAGLNASLNASITGKDTAKRTVEITGSGTPDSSVVIDGKQKASVNADGSWTTTVTNLKDGPTTLHLENIVDTTAVSEKEFTVWQPEAAVPETPEPSVAAPQPSPAPTPDTSTAPKPSTVPAAPTVKVTLEANVSSNALVSGTGKAGATVTIKNGATTIGTATVQPNGSWATRIKALGAGSHTLSVTQTVGTETSPAATTTVDYGQALTVTFPVNSAVVDGKITFTGTGAAGSEIVVRAANRVPVCKVTMTTTGPWSCTDTGNILPIGKYNVLVEQVAKGNLLTTATASVDHVPAGYVKPSVTTPASGSTVANHHPLITGTATPYATIRVKAEAGGTMIDTRAGSNGEWQGTPSFDLAPGKNNLTVTQIVNPGGHTDEVSYSLTATNATPFSVAGPLNSALVAGPITTVGSGPDGALVEVLGTGGVVVGSDTIEDGTWSIIDTDNLLPMGTYQYAVRVAVGTDQTTQLASVRHVPATFTEARVDSPANGSIIDTATPTFTGTATPGATVRLMKGDAVIAEGRALGDRSWTAATTIPLSEGLNRLTVVQIINPGGVTISHDNYLVAKR